MLASHVAKIKNTLNELALIKKKRALDGMPILFQEVFSLLPVLFHYHDSKLPGYIANEVPFGISNYQPNQEILALLDDKFAFKEDSTLTVNSQKKISAIYAMGSTSTLGQSLDSDLDVWLCIESNLSQEEKVILQQKCTLIEAWAKTKEVELTLFIVNVDRFKNQYHECLVGENCGSAQHILLLEEFYRTATHLAGKLLLWFVIPSNYYLLGKQYLSYEGCIQALIDNEAIDFNEWIDFGSLSRLSAEEYFGASLWQLYKSIDHPFKSVLKTLLLEAYSWEYPDCKMIAEKVKLFVQHNKIKALYFDSYYLVLRKVKKYLIQVNDHTRLNFIKTCFYLKSNERLSLPDYQKTSWRYILLKNLTKNWEWDEKKIRDLDESRAWKIEKVRQIHEMLLQTLMSSYRNLLHFGRRNNLDSLINPKDLSILTRKLYATYESLPSKITMINTNISEDLSEEYLTFIHVNSDRVNRKGWYVYKKKPTFDSIISSQHLQYSNSLVKLTAWCYFNGLISDKTTLFYRDGTDHNPSKLKQLILNLQSYFPLSAKNPTETDLYNTCEIRQLAIIVNFKYEISDLVEDNNKFSTDVLNYGEKENCLVKSLHLLYRNSWNEVRILSFDGSLCILNAIRTLLNRMHKNADLPKSTKIFCYNAQLREEIISQIQNLIDRCVTLRLSTAKDNSKQFMPLKINGSSWCLFFERFGVSNHQFTNTMDFYGAISNNKHHGSPLNIWSEINEFPKEIDSVACEGIIQFFFEKKESGFDLYILDENNRAEVYRNCDGKIQNMIRDVNRFYALNDDRFTFSSHLSINFNLPQFYQIDQNDQNEKIVELYAEQF